MTNRKSITMMKKLLMVIVSFFFLAQCNNEEILPNSAFEPQFLVVTSTSVLTNVKSSACSTCTYVATGKPGQIDGAKLGIKPGDVICLDAAIAYGPLTFINMTGTASNPIKIATCGGKVTIQAAGKSFALRVTNSKFFKITGGTSGYNLVLAGGNQGLTLDFKTTEFEVDHLEVANSGFSGIMAKTDPSCDISTQRANFTMRNVSIHDNYIHHSGGEGIYVGNSFYSGGVNNTTCGKIYPHAINGVKIFKNKVQYTGWDGIQLGSAIAGAQVYNNSVEFYGTKNISNQNSGIQIGEGTGGLCYNNSVKTGSGNGIVVLGLGDNKVENNIIIGPGVSGIFCDERYTPGSGFSFTQNIIINPPQDGIQLYAEKVAMNYAVRNVVVNPGNYNKFATDNTWLTGDDAYLHRLCQTLRVTKTSNIFKRNSTQVLEIYNLAYQYNPITSTSNPTSKIPALVTTLGL